MAKTSKQKLRTPEVAYQKVFKDVSKILKPNEDYIYRGEEERFDRPCASSLYRESKRALESYPENPYEPLEKVVARLSKWNRERLIEEIRAYYPDTTDNERLAAVQHLGGATNFVDFSEDLNVALFFACYKKLGKNGRIIVMRSPEKDRESTGMKDDPTNLELLKENKTFIPRRTGNDPGYQRARAQKGLVVYCPEGYIKEDKYKKVEIALQDKLPILKYLRKYHGIDYQTIFYDVHGYIELTKHRHTLLREYLIAVERKKYGDAEEKISGLINMGGTFWEYDARGVLYTIRGDHALALSDYNRALQINTKYGNAYNNRGNTHYSQGKYDKAILDYNKAIEQNPKNSEVYTNRGNAYYSQSKYTQAIADYTEAINLDPKVTEAYYNRGRTHSLQGEYTQAVADYTKVINLNSEDSEAYFDRGNAYASQSDYAQAISDYDKAIDLNPKFNEAYTNRGIAYFEQGKYAQAISDLSKALNLNPENSEVYYNRGNAYRSMGDYIRAISDYGRAVDLNPKLGKAYYNRGREYGLQGEYIQAIADFSKVIKLHPQSSEAYYGRGLAHIAESNLERDEARAKEDYENAVKLDSKWNTPQYRKPFEKYL